MPTTDRSNTARTHYKMGQTVSAFRSLNPTRRLEGPQGMTPSSTLTSVHIGERPFIRDSVTVIPCCHEDTIPFNLATITTLVGTTYTVFANATIPVGNILTIPAGFTFIIPDGVTLTVNGTLRVNGTLVVNGTLINNSFNTTDAANAEINGTFVNNGAATILRLVQNVGAFLVARGVSSFVIGSTIISILNGTIVLEGNATLTVNSDSSVTFSPSSTLTGAPGSKINVNSGGTLTLGTPAANLTLGAIDGLGGVNAGSAATGVKATAAKAPGAGISVTVIAGPGGGGLELL
jgi:hypothetical protein